jgi:hypothetical protein
VGLAGSGGQQFGAAIAQAFDPGVTPGGKGWRGMTLRASAAAVKRWRDGAPLPAADRKIGGRY